MDRADFNRSRFDAPLEPAGGMSVAGTAAWGGASTLGWVQFLPVDLCLWFQDVPVLALVFEDTDEYYLEGGPFRADQRQPDRPAYHVSSGGRPVYSGDLAGR